MTTVANDSGENGPAASAEGGLAPSLAPPPRPRARWLRRGLGALLALVVAIGAFGALLVFSSIEENPFVGRLVRDRLIAALQDRIDPSLSIAIDAVDLARDSHETLVRVKGFVVRAKDGRALVSAPEGVVKLATAPLLALRLTPTAVTLEGLRVNVDIAETGELVVGAGETPATVAEPAATAPAAGPPLLRMQQFIAGAFAGLSAVREAVGGRLPELGVTDAAITVTDRRSGRKYALHGISSRLRATPDGATTADAEIRTAGGPFAVKLSLSAPHGARQTFSARTEKLEIGDILGVAGVKTAAIDGKTQVRLQLSAEVGADHKAVSASAEIALDAAMLTLDPKVAPIPLDRAVLRFDWKDGAETIAIPEAVAVSGGSVVALSGDVVPPATGGEGWRVRLASTEMRLEPMAKGDKPVVMPKIGAELTVRPEDQALAVNRLEMEGPQGRLTLTGNASLAADGRPEMAFNIDVAQADARASLRMWPAFIAPELRAWLAQHVRAGALDQLQLRLALPADAFAAAISDAPLPDGALSVTWRVSNGVLQPLPGGPVFQGVVATGRGTGRTARLDVTSASVDAGGGRRIAIPEGVFSVADTSRKPAEARLVLKLSGGADAMMDLLRTPALQPFAPRGMEQALVRGAFDGELTMLMKLSPQMAPGDTRVSVVAALKGLSVDKAFGAEKIDNGAFQLTADRDGFAMKGEARFLGAPAQIDLKGAGKAPVVATVSLVLDEAARKRQGLPVGPALTGPVGVKITTRLENPDDREAMLDVDLSRATINELLPGFSKKAGAPARLRGAASETANGGWQVDKMEFDAGPVQARGSVTLGEDGQFQKAKLSSLRLSSGDSAQVDADRTGGVLKLDLRGNSFDARPFLRSILTGSIDKAGGKDVDLTLRTTVLSGFNGEIVANADLKLGVRGSELRRFDLAGRFDGGPITARLEGAGAQARLAIGTDDAGAFLRFFDVYNRMRGGRLDLVAALGKGSQSGTMQARNFILRDEPGLKRLVADTGAQGSNDSSRIDNEALRRLRNVQDVPFSRMTMTFVRTPGRLAISDATLIGPEIGGNIVGFLDYARDRVELTGTFVPAFSLNNLVANVPIVGPFIAGGRNEGLFAVRYNIVGKVSAPTLSINPLTAIAPGFLRKLIDFQGNGGAAPAPRPAP